MLYYFCQPFLCSELNVSIHGKEPCLRGLIIFMGKIIFERTLHVTLLLVNEIKISINLWNLSLN